MIWTELLLHEENVIRKYLFVELSLVVKYSCSAAQGIAVCIHITNIGDLNGTDLGPVFPQQINLPLI